MRCWFFLTKNQYVFKFSVKSIAPRHGAFIVNENHGIAEVIQKTMPCLSLMRKVDFCEAKRPRETSEGLPFSRLTPPAPLTRGVAKTVARLRVGHTLCMADRQLLSMLASTVSNESIRKTALLPTKYGAKPSHSAIFCDRAFISVPI